MNASKTKELYRCEGCRLRFEQGIQEGKAKALKEVEKIVNDWYDVGIDLPNSNLQLMATNGGYIKKFDLLKKLKELGGTK